MYVFGEGELASRVKIIKPGRPVATFTVQLEKDRFYVKTTGLEQFRTVTVMDPGDKLLILGSLSSFVGKCGQHHVVIRPQILLAVDGLNGEQSAILYAVVQQWTAAGLASEVEMIRNM